MVIGAKVVQQHRGEVISCLLGRLPARHAPRLRLHRRPRACPPLFLLLVILIHGRGGGRGASSFRLRAARPGPARRHLVLALLRRHHHHVRFLAKHREPWCDADGRLRVAWHAGGGRGEEWVGEDRYPGQGERWRRPARRVRARSLPSRRRTHVPRPNHEADGGEHLRAVLRLLLVLVHDVLVLEHLVEDLGRRPPPVPRHIHQAVLFLLAETRLAR